MRIRSGGNDARAGLQLRQQHVRHDKIRHVIGGEGLFQTVFGDLARVEQRARIVHQHVDLRFSGQLVRQPLHLRDARQIGEVDGVGRAGKFLQRRVGTRAVTRHQNDARTLLRKTDSRDLADTGGRPRDDDCLALHVCLRTGGRLAAATGGYRDR
jgi:hypothetical protein